MLRLHKSDHVPKYKSGKWIFNDKEQRLQFQAHTDLKIFADNYIMTNNFKFRKTMNQVEELIFRQVYARPAFVTDANVVLIQDIRNLVLFLMPASFLTKDFLTFVHSQEVYHFWHSLITYFESFLRVVELLLILRDEVKGSDGKIHSSHSSHSKRSLSLQLSQYRLILARSYALIICGQGNMAPYHHMVPVLRISRTRKDRVFHERFLAVSTQLTWIAMHRRAYNVIEVEMSRLFRSEHFRITAKQELTFTPHEACILYGRNYKRLNYRQQHSPLLQELMNVSDADRPLLWIGERKYRGTDQRIHELEMEYLVPDSQLVLIDKAHGILGHPKKYYNTLLQLDWETVRFENYTLVHDPYQLIRQPELRLPKPNVEHLRQFAKEYERYFSIKANFKPISTKMFDKWMNRRHIVEHYTEVGLLTTVLKRCERDLKRHKGQRKFQSKPLGETTEPAQQ